MTQTGKFSKVENLSRLFSPPVLIVSTKVGRGMYTMGEAVEQRLSHLCGEIEHVAIEDFVSPAVVTEDLEHYKWISNNYPILLYLAYKTPFVYLRKYLREKYFRTLDIEPLAEKVSRLSPGSIICVSHRPAFWVSALRRRLKLSIPVWGLLGEYGKNVGWQYIFWDQMQGYLSPVDEKEVGIRIPARVQVLPIELPVRREFEELAESPGSRSHTLVVCGYWGQGPLVKILDSLIKRFPNLTVHAVFGENHAALAEADKLFASEPRVKLHGTVDSLLPLLDKCGSVITKPGISTLLESHAAKRKVFLLKGMPVAEDNNARFACSSFGAEWFSLDAFDAWFNRLPEH